MTLSIHNPRVISHARALGITDLEARDRLLAIDMTEAKYQAACCECNAATEFEDFSVWAVSYFRPPPLRQRIRDFFTDFFNLDEFISPDWNKYS